MRSRKSGISRRPFNAFNVRGKTRIWIINADLQDLIACCTTGCQLSHWTTITLWGQILCFFESMRHNYWEIEFRVLAAIVDFLLI